MIISPSPRPTTNVLRVINNAYKCVDLVYMLSQSQDDCNLWLQRLYWERDPEDDFVAPNFVPRTRTLMLIRDDLAGVDPDSGLEVTTHLRVPFRLFEQAGYGIKGELLPPQPEWRRTAVPEVSPSSSFVVSSSDDPSIEAYWKWGLTRSYFPPHMLRLRIARTDQWGTQQLVTAANLLNYSVSESTVVRFQFGEERKVHAVLFYRPRNGFIGETFNDGYASGDSRELQLLSLQGYADEYSVLFSTATSPDFKEFEAELLTERHLTDTSPRLSYSGGIPHVINLETPTTEKELFLRWTGQLTHFQVLDSPIIKTSGWYLSEHPDMKYEWPFLADRYPERLDHPDFDNGRQEFDFIGDFSTGIRFRSPRMPPVSEQPVSDWDGEGDWCRFVCEHPYLSVNPYTAVCEWFSVGDNEIETKDIGDIWLLEDFGWHQRVAYCDRFCDGTYDYETWSREGRGLPRFDPNEFNQNIDFWVDDFEGVRRYFSLRAVGDNKYYVANKHLLKWYFTPETNTWKSNHTRASTEEQLRFIITLPEVQLVRGCINPMSVPAIWNKPMFVADFGTGLRSRFQFNPNLYDNYIVPWRVLIEGRRDMNPRTPWELMDEYPLEHFSTRAHVYFSYPRRVRFIRITVQDWYGTTLMEDVRNDWFYPASIGEYGEHWGAYSGIHANHVVRRGRDYTVGRCMDELVTTPLGSLTLSHDFSEARIEWQKWRAKTMQSLWKSIYIPPFLFFGENGED